MEDSKRQHGFTLLELMVTLTIAALVLGMAVPSFRSLMERNRLVTYTNDFISTANLARSEAVRRGASVSICRSNDGEKCTGTWSDGWITFLDLNGDGTADDAASEPVLRVHEALAKNYTLSPDPVFDSAVTYGADGSATASGAFALCHDGKLEGSRAIILNRLRVRVAHDTDNDRVPNLDGGDVEDCSEPSGS